MGLERASERLVQANNQLARLSRVDGLTGLFNRRHFDEQLDIYWRECRRLETPISIIMIDVDHFKKYNDRYGHVAGDECLRKVADCLRSSLRRATDFLARYGGEEFVVIIKDDLDKSKRVADNLVRAIRELKLEHSETELGIVTLSLGVASTVPGRDGLATDLLKLADQGLYLSKEIGRNTFSVSPNSPVLRQQPSGPDYASEPSLLDANGSRTTNVTATL
ncbi:MAG: GGDEF domain-containing protein [Kofleriaceae bacterium]|nr:GGDEF domain-containing protein [Kofleriaceae bacterium]